MTATSFSCQHISSPHNDRLNTIWIRLKCFIEIYLFNRFFLSFLFFFFLVQASVKHTET